MLAAVLGYLAGEEESPFDILEARRAAAETLHDEGVAPHYQLAHAARRVGLRLRSFTADPQEAADLTARGTRLATFLPPGPLEGWWLLTQVSGDQLGLARPGEPASLVWLRPEQIREALAAAETDPEEPEAGPEWFAAEPGLPCPGSTPSDETSHGAHASHISHAPHAPYDPHHHEGMEPTLRLWEFLRPELGDIWVVFIFAIFVGLLTLAIPVAVEALVNTVAFGRYLQPVLILAGVLFCFLALGAVARAMQAYVVELLQQRVFVRVVADLSERLPRMRLDSSDGEHSPELVNRFFDVVTVQKVIASLLVDGLTIVIQTIIGMAVLACYHPYLLGYDLVLVMCLFVVVFWIGQGGVTTAINESRKKYDVAAWLEELARHPSTFKNELGAEQAMDRADRLARQYVLARQEHFQVVFRQLVFLLAMQAVAATALLGVGGWLVISGELTLGQLVAAELIVAIIVGGFVKLAKHFESYYDLLASMDKLGHLFDLPLEPSARELFPRPTGPLSVRLTQATYHYPSTRGGLPATTVRCAAGSRVAIVGPPGSGKSTLLAVLYKLREFTSGVVELDGVDLRSVDPVSLREHIALIGAPEIFAGTIAENIHLGRHHLGFREVRAALEAVELHEEIARLPAGLETHLETFGAPLSQSQIHRLMLARAIVAKPRLLLIDGALDNLPQSLLDRILPRLFDPLAPWTLLIVSARPEILFRCRERWELGAPRAAPAVAPAAVTLGERS